MSSAEDELLESFNKLGIPSTHSSVGLSNLIAGNKQYKSLFSNRRLPETGWSDLQIQHFLYTLSTLDTNNKDNLSSSSSSSSSRWCGVGEREGRVFSSLVSQRHFHLSHGVGRSGDIAEAQPKAVGSTVLARLALALTLDATRRGSGLDKQTSAKHGILLPLCTGMTMSLLLSTLRGQRVQQNNNLREKREISGNDDHHHYDYCVLWCRIDQKSCLKAIVTAGLRVVVIPTVRKGDEVVTDLEALRRAVDSEGRNIVAVISTTSCFAPRVPDPVDEIAKLCRGGANNSNGASKDEDDDPGIPHVINNAYGLQCPTTSKLINRACAVGRVDAVVFSMDKNFMVPVGGAVVLSPRHSLVLNVGKVYAGRASASPIVDLFITLLSMGLDGYRSLLQRRSSLREIFSSRLAAMATKHNERLLVCPRNTISFGITLDSLLRHDDDEQQQQQDGDWKKVGNEISYLGSMLFTRCVSGTRVVPRFQTKSVCGIDFTGFGSSTDDYPHAYLTAACAIGLAEPEISEFMDRLDKAMKDFKTKQKKKKRKMKEYTNKEEIVSTS